MDNLTVAVIYKLWLDRKWFIQYRPNKKDAEDWLLNEVKKDKNIENPKEYCEKNFVIEEVPFFEILNQLKRSCDSLESELNHMDCGRKGIG